MSEVTFGVELATLLIVLSSAVYGIIVWIKRRREEGEYEKLMEDPVEVHFRIPARNQYLIKYEKQDDGDYVRDELVLPINFEDHIFLIIKPKLNLKVIDSYFGFGPIDGKRPELSYSNVFIIKSSDQPRWAIDSYGCIHFNYERHWLSGETYLSSFKINTHEKGDFPIEITFNVSSNEFKEVKKEISKHIVKHLKLSVIIPREING